MFWCLLLLLFVNLLSKKTVVCEDNKEIPNNEEEEGTKLTDSLDFKIAIATLCGLLFLLALIALMIFQKCKQSKPSRPSNQTGGDKKKKTKWSIMLDRRPLPKLPPESRTSSQSKNEKNGLRKLSKNKILRMENFDSPRKSYDITNSNSPQTKDSKTIENAVIEVHDGIGTIENIEETYDYAPSVTENRSNSSNQSMEHQSNSINQSIEQRSNSNNLNTEERSNSSELYEYTIHGYARNGPDYASSYEDLVTTSVSDKIENCAAPQTNHDNYATRKPYELDYEEPDCAYGELVTALYQTSLDYEDLNDRAEDNRVAGTFSAEMYETLNQSKAEDEKDYYEGYEIPVESIMD